MGPHNLPFKVVIPSHGRPAKILNNPLYPVAHVVVRDYDVRDQYLGAAARAGVAHGEFHVTGRLANIAEIRQWILDNLFDDGDPFIFVSDDDLEYVRPTMAWRHKRMTNLDDILTIIQESYNAALDAGAGLFGYSNTGAPNRRLVSTPFSLRTYLMGQVGILDHSLHYDTRLFLMEDVDISVLSLAKSRIVWNDRRYYWHCGKQWSEGGISANRTTERLYESRDLINAKYGDGTVRTLENKARNPYRFTLNV